ncbi:MAG: acyl-CoA thioesterase [Burkholderiales bacterium]|nr:acyl-CoA thioesterase [Burkholderiales bacterium]
MIRIFAYPIKVDESCIDVMGHTNNKVYLRWMEEAALAHSGAVGWPTEKYFEKGGAFITKQHWVQYIRPTFLGEELTMYTWCAEMAERSALRRFQLMRNGKTCMKAATDWAFIDTHTGRAIPVFPEVREIFPEVPSNDPELLGLKIHIHEFSRENL